MIRLQRITTADTDLYSSMEKLMTQSFPSEEYRELEELRKYTDTKTHFYNNIIFHNNTPVGLITYWDFGHFYYIEHFAIDPAQRNGGYGKSVVIIVCEKPLHNGALSRAGKTGNNNQTSSFTHPDPLLLPNLSCHPTESCGRWYPAAGRTESQRIPQSSGLPSCAVPEWRR